MEKIVIFSAFYEPFMSGAERMAKEVIERLQNRYCFIIITGRFTKRSEKLEIRGENYIIRRIGFGFKFDKFLYPLLAPFYALQYRSQIIHAVMESYAGISLLIYWFLNLFLRRKGFTILTLQSGDLDLPEKQKRIPKWLWKGIHSKPDLVVSIGNSMATRARRLGARKVIVIPNGVDLVAAEKARAENLPKEPHRLVCVARLSPEKGLEHLIEAMPKIMKEFSRANLVLVGDGALRKQLEVKCQMSNVKCQFLGNLPHDKTLKEISKSEVLVLPSLAEGMGIVLAEAQALGVPVVGTNVGGIPDVIEHEKTGLLVLPRDSDLIARAVTRLFREKELAAKMATEAKIRLGKFDWKSIADKYETVYKKFFKKSILIATGGYIEQDIGGPSLYSFNINHGLRKNEFRTVVVSYGKKSIDCEKFDITGEPLQPYYINRNGTLFNRYFEYFLQLKKQGQHADLIYVQDPVSAGFPAMLASLFLRKPLVLKIVGDYAWEQSQFQTSNLKFQNLDEFLKHKPNGKIKLLWDIERWVARRANKIIVPSNYLKSVVERWGIPANKIEVIYNTFDWESIVLPRISGRIPDHDIIYSVGRLVPWKGFDTLIEVMADIIKERPDVELIIYGDGPMRESLITKIHDLRIENNVKLLGRIEHDELLEKLQGERKFFVLNSSYEGMSHQILECQALGVPVAVSRVGGNPEIVEDEETGLLFEYNNKEQIKQEILRLLTDNNLVEKITAKAKEQIKERHDFNKMINKTIQVLHESINVKP